MKRTKGPRITQARTLIRMRIDMRIRMVMRVGRSPSALEARAILCSSPVHRGFRVEPRDKGSLSPFLRGRLPPAASRRVCPSPCPMGHASPTIISPLAKQAVARPSDRDICRSGCNVENAHWNACRKAGTGDEKKRGRALYFTVFHHFRALFPNAENYRHPRTRACFHFLFVAAFVCKGKERDRERKRAEFRLKIDKLFLLFFFGYRFNY